MTLQEYLKTSNQRQYDFAARVECSPGTISLIVSGNVIPRPALMNRIIAATGDQVTTADFYQKAG